MLTRIYGVARSASSPVHESRKKNGSTSCYDGGFKWCVQR
ncbi:hypothetical protein HMPREF9154_0689 [Arachnia propionica F0230a]|nr:hypothetical protein HMPREF9154_0689 [Arachnia propionica F0230a]